MAVRLGDIAPDFTAPTTQGDISFHEWLGNSWGVLFSHPKDFTPVCTTELGYVARIKPEFDKRNVKVIGLSVDPVDSHVKWEGDIAETQGTALNFPLVADPTELDAQRRFTRIPGEALRPFDDCHPKVDPWVDETQRDGVTLWIQAIGVDVGDGQPTGVLGGEDKGW